MKFLRGKEYVSAILLAFLGAAVLWKGAKLASLYWQSVMANAGVTLLGLSAAILIVNAYFDYRNRKSAVHSLLRLVAPAIKEHHNELLHEAWNVFGRPQWKEMVERYKENNGDPMGLGSRGTSTPLRLNQSQEAALRRKIYEIGRDP